MYQHIKVPEGGQKITVNPDFSLNVPNNPIIPYIEGDGVWVRKSERSSIELSHFVVHTGSDSSCRKKLQNKFEVIKNNFKFISLSIFSKVMYSFKEIPLIFIKIKGAIKIITISLNIVT